ncbi:hypothetical protein [Streptomyces sp. NBC_00005]|uniref:hypothetical protein n=1 Tax=Streptomyces sp. NBC_00005 TaxID=2903609 RepID=UPI00324A816E
MTRSTTGTTRLHSLTTLAIGVTATMALTACGADADKDSAASPRSSASPTSQGVVTKETAKKVVDDYERVNNSANKARDEKLLATVEAGQVHEQSKADYKLFKTWSAKDQKEYGSPFFYKNRTYYLPATGTATWFAVKAKSSGSDDDALLIFDRTGGTYKLVASAYSDEALPEIAVDRNGLVTAVDASKKVGTLAPDQLGTVYEDLFETGGQKAAKQLATTSATKDSVKVYKERDTGNLARYATKKYFAKEPSHPKVYALKLADGGVVTVFPTAHTQERMLKPQYMSSFQIGPNDEEAVYNSTKRTVITDLFQGQGLAELSTKGKPRVTAIGYRMVDSH